MKFNYIALALFAFTIISIVIVSAATNETAGNVTNTTNESLEVPEIDPINAEINTTNQTNTTNESAILSEILPELETHTTLNETNSTNENQTNSSNRNEVSEEEEIPAITLPEQNETNHSVQEPERVFSIEEKPIIKRLDNLDMNKIPQGVKAIDTCSEETYIERTPVYDGKEIALINEVQKTKKQCRARSLQINDKYNLPLDEYSCLPTEENGVIIIICDSKKDGNGDGICQSGESCMKYEFSDDKMQQYEKNSQEEFLSSDETFFLERITVEVIA